MSYSTNHGTDMICQNNFDNKMIISDKIIPNSKLIISLPGNFVLLGLKWGSLVADIKFFIKVKLLQAVSSIMVYGNIFVL